MTETIRQHLRRRPAVAQFVKYGIVGMANTALSLAIILVGAWLGVWHIGAYVVAWTAGAANGYRINRSWTFRAGPSHRTLVVRYFVVQAVALVISTGLLYLLADVAGLDKLLAQFVAIAVAVTASFVANRWWTFADTVPPPGEASGAPAPVP